MDKLNVNDFRKADYLIDEMFINRWSPRAFSGKEVEEAVLMSIFEAARWAPSASNKQPWRFVIASTKEEKDLFNQFIMEGNLKWCKAAPVYALLLSDTEAGGAHAFDAGTAWGYLSLQAWKNGLITHAMGGIYKDKARELLNIPDQYDVHALIAIGYQDDISILEEAYQEREKPSNRRSLKETIIKGSF
ncbi:nitroreductase family protein [Gracilibacillus oryzae]|uniref:Nitroreductase family protein n=1 Tax=Gracilibacillus oryzae TaxID=1672701 RepID=A0A7C8GQF3_9BACI|nr:nitroreductase family protein [Gracilibacillus oryzae]KAB8126357.1 nitroreductase family protein [Gracilibacillus oryzae]